MPKKSARSAKKAAPKKASQKKVVAKKADAQKATRSKTARPKLEMTSVSELRSAAKASALRRLLKLK